jgi:hypothetical protein
VDAVGRAYPHGADRCPQHAGADLGLDVVDLVDRDPEEAGEPPRLGAAA